MTDTAKHILLVEDNPGDARLIQEMLKEQRDDFYHFIHASSLPEASEQLIGNTIDIVLLDLNLPGSTGIDTFYKFYDQNQQLPIIILSGVIDIDIALQAVQGGAQDYLAKGQFDGNILARVISYSIERKQKEKMLRESDQKFINAFQHSGIGMALVSIEGKWLQVNQRLCNMLGYSEGELLRKTFQEITHPDDLDTDLDNVAKVLAGKMQTYTMEKRYYHKNGSIIQVLLTVSLVLDNSGNPMYFISQINDITDRKEAEKIIRDKLKREAFISTLSTNFINLPSDKIDSSINRALKNFSKITGSNRASLFLFSDQESKLSNTHEWCARPKDSQIDLLQNIPAESFGYYLKLLKQHENVIIGRIDDLPPEAQDERRWSQEHGFRPLVFVPLLFGDKLYGTLGLYGAVGTTMTWSEETTIYLKMMGDIFVNIIERKKAEIKNHQKSEDLALINEMNKEINKEADLEHIFNVLATITKKTFSSFGANVLLVSENGNELLMPVLVYPSASLKAIEKLIGRKIPDIRLKLDSDSYYEKVLQDEKSRIINDSETIGQIIMEYVLSVAKPGTKTYRLLRGLMPSIVNILKINSIMQSPLIADGECVGILGITRSHPFTESELRRFIFVSSQVTTIIKRKQSDEQRDQALKLAERAGQVKSLFIANVSHEIRTPLNSIIGFNDLLHNNLGDRLKPEEQNFFEFIKQGSKRLLGTVDSILNISQLEAGMMNITPQQIRIGKLIKLICDDLRPKAVAKGVQLEYLSLTRKDAVLIDEYSISQATMNIIQNAIKFTNEGGVKVQLEDRQKRLVLTISDTGVGISEENQQRIFQPFTQESEGYTKDYQGIGLGLTLAKHFLDLNNVSIQVSSEKGKGSTFTLTLPENKVD